MPTATATLREHCFAHNTVVLDGHTWDWLQMSPTGKTVHLTRTVRVKAHWHRFKYNAGGFRHVTIRRPAETLAVKA
jgi:hypothetical protein